MASGGTAGQALAMHVQRTVGATGGGWVYHVLDCLDERVRLCRDDEDPGAREGTRAQERNERPSETAASGQGVRQHESHPEP